MLREAQTTWRIHVPVAPTELSAKSSHQLPAIPDQEWRRHLDNGLSIPTTRADVTWTRDEPLSPILPIFLIKVGKNKTINLSH